ncbi:RAM2 [Nakaseomyces glabratus]|nr:Protein prenyltransferases alpha subunit repeat profile [Nakaseomyces glabratus]KAH7581694.1 Protein prenyltransferases alpha subunit repeat profile [Nakaseomyces glabratus]KAH7582585.1 Protein prenyltransferases alpha subunit repeat profile [Nakaseomyces glabratus]KAH7595256.1 Protein prenyltransferases alpha subunit repeat profile [Nakaseomyces glabratus]KAH7595685.1 Protein prenyltransferases alpha subunit repeat profile [Nakaseomyces glabratus]
MKESAMLSWCAENFGDVEPMPIEMGSDELCKILYSDEYKLLLGLCRRLMSLGELSQRALLLTAKVIAIAPAFYTVWNYRYSIIKEQLSSLDKVEQGALVNKELDWLDEVTLSNPKNYQIWSYRQALLKVHPSPQLKRELPIIQLMIDEDTKNYHVWSYRKWCVLFFKDFNHELPFTDMMIRRDIYNNSAWTHRMFVWQHTESSSTQVIAEIDNYLRGKIELAPQNISCWTYLRGLYELFLHENYDPSIIRFAEGFIDGVLDSDSTAEKIETIESSYALEFLAHVYSRNPSTQEKALRAYQLLSDKFDPIRANLWQHKIKQLKSS